MAQINKPSLHFNTKLYTGNGSTQSITGVGFQPDWTWIKRRDGGTAHHQLFDVIRGATKRIYSSSTAAEDTGSDTLTAFDSDGFSVGANAGVNGSSNATVAWNWKAGGAGSANTDGATASTVSVNNTAGFSIVKWTGTSGNTTVGHGLNTAPTFTIVKNYGGSGTNWVVYHKNISPDYAIKLNTTDAQSNSNNYWQSTAPTNSLLTFTGGTASNSNGNNMIGYCFAEKKGYSKFGLYSANGNADGPFVYTGFKPAWILRKCITSSTAEVWVINDNQRPGYNQTQLGIFPNNSNVEDTATHNAIDILSNGFKCRTSDGRTNGSSKNYIYAAFASEPLVGTNNIPATAG